MQRFPTVPRLCCYINTYGLNNTVSNPQLRSTYSLNIFWDMMWASHTALTGTWCVHMLISNSIAYLNATDVWVVRGFKLEHRQPYDLSGRRNKCSTWRQGMNLWTFNHNSVTGVGGVPRQIVSTIWMYSKNQSGSIIQWKLTWNKTSLLLAQLHIKVYLWKLRYNPFIKPFIRAREFAHTWFSTTVKKE